MEYVAVSARFLIFNGVKRYTVEYCYGLHKWYVFNEQETKGAIYTKENKDVREGSIGKFEAGDILYDYLKKIKNPTT